MKNTIKLFTILFIIAFLLLGYSTVAKAVENQYLTIDNVSSEVGQKAKVEIKAKTDLIVDDINLEISYDDTKLSVSTSDIKVNDMLTNDSDKGIKNGVIVETSDLETVKKEASEGNYIIEVDNAKQARMVIGDMANAEDNNHIQIHADRENIPFIVKKLVLQDIKIYSIKEDVMSLEDAFFKKTGGNIID